MSRKTRKVSSPESTSEVLAAYLKECSPLRWPPPWDFLAPDPDCFEPVSDDRAALDRLRGQFDETRLRQAGILETGPDGAPRLSPPLSDPTGAVIALRSAVGEKPFDLITARGCVLSRDLPLVVAARDGRTRVEMAKSGWIVVSTDIREAALMHALGLPAAPATGLPPTSLEMLRPAVQAFGWAPRDCSQEAAALWGGKPSGASLSDTREAEDPAATPPSPAGAQADKPSGFPLAVVFVAWDLLSLRRAVPALLLPLVESLEELRSHLGLNLLGLSLWRPREDYLKTVRCRIRFRDACLVRDALPTGPFWDLHPLHALADPNSNFHREGPPLPQRLPEAHEQLIDYLVKDREREHSAWGVGNPFLPHQMAVRRELTAPVQEWALRQGEPVPRIVGLELANILPLLHQLGPAVFDLNTEEIARIRAGRGPGPRTGLSAQYMQLLARTTSLLKLLPRPTAPPPSPPPDPDPDE